MIKPAVLSFVLAFAFSGVAVSQDDLAGATLLYEQGLLAQAKSSFEALARKNPRQPEPHYYLGRIAFQESVLDRSAAEFQKAVELAPRSAEYHYWLGRAYGEQAMKANIFKKMSFASKVRSEFETAVKLDPKHIEARFGLIDYYTIAPGVAGGSEEKAKELVAELRRIDPMMAHLAAARIHRRNKQDDLVEKEYLEAAAEFPAKAQPRLWLAVQYTTTKDYDKALQQLDAALRIDPSHMPTQYHIGRFAAISGRELDRGEVALKKYLAYLPKGEEPSLGTAHFRLGEIYEKKGQKDLALREFREALRLVPNSKEAAEAIKRLK